MWAERVQQSSMSLPPNLPASVNDTVSFLETPPYPPSGWIAGGKVSQTLPTSSPSRPSAVPHGARGRGRPVDFVPDMAIAPAPPVNSQCWPRPLLTAQHGAASAGRSDGRVTTADPEHRGRTDRRHPPRPTFRIEVHGFQGSQEGIPQAQAVGHDEVQVAGRHYALLQGERGTRDGPSAATSNRDTHPDGGRPRVLPHAL